MRGLQNAVFPGKQMQAGYNTHFRGDRGGGGGVEMSPYRLEQGKTHKLNLGNNDKIYNFRI